MGEVDRLLVLRARLRHQRQLVFLSWMRLIQSAHKEFDWSKFDGRAVQDAGKSDGIQTGIADGSMIKQLCSY